MKTVQKSVLIWFSPQEMSLLVENVPDYPQFLPWCDSAQVLARHDDGVTARLGLRFGSLTHQFSTRNTVGALASGERQVRLQLVDGPFSRLDGAWHFRPLGDGRQRACRVELLLNYDFANAALAALIGPVFDKIAASLVDAFVARAETVYGGAP